MHVDKSINIIDDYELSMKLDHFIQSRSQDVSVKRRLKEWASTDFCDHEKEPLVSFQMNGNVQFFGLFRPACDDCLNKKSIIFSREASNPQLYSKRIIHEISELFLQSSVSCFYYRLLD